ncbi:P-loop containing nucleoside triphosphate hydrolase protein [Pilatotrama ljubarskyi]|nr:P-loop containing nucleoside triphosphate hydrolase protein [Pilatotrama ljubarskyi]
MNRPSQGPPCRFYTRPGGCKNGSSCTFAHVDGGRPSTPPNHSGSRLSFNSRPTIPKAPPGVCNYYYDRGFCSRGSDCRFRHEVNPSKVQKDGAGAVLGGGSAIDSVAEFLTPTALARIRGPGTDGFFASPTTAMTPSAVRHHLNRFLEDGYRFKYAADVYGFVTLLSNASSGNATWLFLSAIGTDNGLLRIGDILSWSEVSVRPTTRTALSFQRGYVPLLRYLSSEYVVKSITSKVVNSLYSLIMEHFDHFSEVVRACMEDALTGRKTFKDQTFSNQNDLTGSQVLSCIAQVLFEYITRFKNAVATHPSLRPLVQSLSDWTETWITAISSTPPTFDDPLVKAPAQARRFVLDRLHELVGRLLSIVDRKQRELDRSKQPQPDSLVVPSGAPANEGILAALHNAYQGPGTLRPEGPRHDNDFINIGDIQIAPTHDELTSPLQPFLPANLYGAPHPLPAESMEQLLDIQFRLLREELTASLRVSAHAILTDLKDSRAGKRVQLDELIKKKGGKYRGHAVGQDTVLFNVYTGAEFSTLTPTQRGITVGIAIDTPPGRARAGQAKTRVQFWEGMSSKRLMQGGLVALVWQRTNGETEVHLGTVASSLKDLTESAKQNADRLEIRISFFSPEVELRILQELRIPVRDRRGTKLLIEATVMFESIRPFLEALRVEPESIPFARYLVHRPPAFYRTLQISPPAYAALPGFHFKLASLFPPEAGFDDLKLVVTDPESVESARNALKQSSRLDPSQADAMVDALIREISLIQGPPGTGKTYTGIELLRVLIANGAGPILMISFTNHALDHMLRSVLDAHITQKIVRLGSRSADDRIAEFSIENMENVAGRTRLSAAYSGYRRDLRDVEQEIKDFMDYFFKQDVDTDDLIRYLTFQSPALLDSIEDPPEWVQALYDLRQAEEAGGWRVAGKDSLYSDSLYDFWVRGGDIEFLHDAHRTLLYRHPPSPQRQLPKQRPNNQYEILRSGSLRDTGPDDSEFSEILPEEEWLRDALVLDLEANPSDSESEGLEYLTPEASASPASAIRATPAVTDSPVRDETKHQPLPLSVRPDDFRNLSAFFAAFGCADIPAVPTTTRPVQELREQEDAWSMSSTERQQLHGMWSDEVRITSQETQTMEFRRLREKHAQAARDYMEAQAEIRKQLLRNVDIIGCTTTGAAKLTALLKGIGPKILLVEEAGQVLEAHILGSLVPSIQHLILIGDPLQLRPTLNNYSLSMDHPHGRLVYKFDMSLMERLSSSGLPMSQINVQRRMRPEIADLVRIPLYPRLEDHDLVKEYPHVRGMAKDVFFFTHDHKENGGEDDFVSKYNQFEVDMIKDLVLYLLRQGPYSAEGDIVVLCAYLGQLARLREALSSEVAVVLDERDQAELDDRTAEAEESTQTGAAFERVRVSRRVLLRTIDNFQGEEAKIIILSLVRNSGGSEEDEAVYGHSAKGRVNIGFLRSENRINVALSRAREGLYIIGNAQNLAAKSKMWRTVLDELRKRDCIGDAFPVACQRHPDAVQRVSKPGQLPRIAPDGGCLLQCDTRLKCGHLCPYKCHSDDPRHVTVTCEQRCTRLCPRAHPCTKACAEPCGQCVTEVAQVELPCGHTAPSVQCFQLDNLADVFCAVPVTRRLPGCEHEATMRCSDNPRYFVCKTTCAGVMSCCGRSCKARCNQCQVLNGPPEPSQNDDLEGSEERSAVVQRVKHVSHPCQRSLFCGHLCGKECAREHECTIFCKAPCRQVCVHARCRNFCSTPCAPCQEPCTWHCAHQACPLPCGAICSRLPCDQRCEKSLACGHRCPSVCGEDCSIQTCTICAPEEVQQKVVDVVMQRTLAELDVNSESLDELTITIPACRHVFTVETLDGICELKEYYRRDERNGKWVGLETPPSGFKQPPACPTCRAAITSPRYGRVFKRADLDILENNVASHMSQSLNSVRRKVDSFSKPDAQRKIRETASDISSAPPKVSNKALKAQQGAQARLLRSIRNGPVKLDAIDPLNASLHSLPTEEAKAWKKALISLFTTYREAVSITETRSAHSHAWEASFAYLFQKEMDSIAANPTAAPRNPQEYAMRAARMKVGQPPPRADKRFLVEAFWGTITIRLTLAELAGDWLDALNEHPRYPVGNKRIWATYIAFVLRSCASDAQIALQITRYSESHHQEANTVVLIMRIELEQFRFNMKMTKQSGKVSQDVRTKLADSADAKLREATQRVDEVTARVSRRGNGGGAEWLQTEFVRPTSTILDEWKSLGRSLRSDTFYQAVSLDELTQVVQAFRWEFTHTGHFYKCPNGHTFVIGDCGGAMQRSVCPECGEAIGGSNHNLVSGNTRAVELEEIARRQGAQPSPWRWGI